MDCNKENHGSTEVPWRHDESPHGSSVFPLEAPTKAPWTSVPMVAKQATCKHIRSTTKASWKQERHHESTTQVPWKSHGSTTEAQYKLPWNTAVLP